MSKLKTAYRGGGHRCRPILGENLRFLQSTLQPTTEAKHQYRTKWYVSPPAWAD